MSACSLLSTIYDDKTFFAPRAARAKKITKVDIFSVTYNLVYIRTRYAFTFITPGMGYVCMEMLQLLFFVPGSLLPLLQDCQRYDIVAIALAL